MAGAGKSILTFLVIGVGVVGAGAAVYYLTRGNKEVVSENRPASKKVEIGKDTLQQLKSLGYVN